MPSKSKSGLEMAALLEAIERDDAAAVARLIRTQPGLASSGVADAKLYQGAIFHWLYIGDTALHLAAAGYRVVIAKALLKAGADSNAADNHRASAPLHYASDGYIVHPSWNAKHQVRMVDCLLRAGADLQAQDKNGATPLHRAVRTRCAAAVAQLLDAGADPTRTNKPGSTPFHLAVQNTGRGGSGDAQAQQAQRRIIAEFLKRGVSTAMLDGKGKSVLDWARGRWVFELLS